jgi:hypothetical protein
MLLVLLCGTPIFSLEGDASLSCFAHRMEIKLMDHIATSFLTLQEASDYPSHRKRMLDNMGWMRIGPAFRGTAAASAMTQKSCDAGP